MSRTQDPHTQLSTQRDRKETLDRLRLCLHPHSQSGTSQQISLWFYWLSYLISLIFKIVINLKCHKILFSVSNSFCLSLCLLQAVHYLHLSPRGQCEANDHHPGTHAPKGVGRGENRNLPIISKNKPGVSVHKVLTTTGT